MRNSFNPYSQQTQSQAHSINVAQFMSKVYLWMMFGLAISAGVAYYVFSDEALFGKLIHSHGTVLLLILAQFAAVVVLTWLNKRLSAGAATVIYLLYAVLSGITLSTILFAYTKQNIFTAFAVTSAAFLGLSAFGYITKRNLGPIGTFCMMGLYGIIAIFLLSLFMPSLHSNTMQLTISTIGVIVFSGLTAYDTQRIKLAYVQSGGWTASQDRKSAINGALMLYLDFINLFLMILNLFSRR